MLLQRLWDWCLFLIQKNPIERSCLIWMQAIIFIFFSQAENNCYNILNGNIPAFISPNPPKFSQNETEIILNRKICNLLALETKFIVAVLELLFLIFLPGSIFLKSVNEMWNSRHPLWELCKKQTYGTLSRLLADSNVCACQRSGRWNWS